LRSWSFFRKSGEPCRTDLHTQNQRLAAPNRKKPAIEKAGTFPGAANHLQPGWANENPGALAGATGANHIQNGSNREANDTLFAGQKAIPACYRHRRAAWSLGCALTVNNPDAWALLVTVFEDRLTEDERAGIAYAALRAMDEDNAYRLASMTLFGVYAGEVLQ